MACYICGAADTSDEHAPARCFFPTDKRDNLITVRSCNEHNQDTSKDDEYVRNIIAMSIGNNGVAQQHFLNSCIKSFVKSPKLLSMTTAVAVTAHIKQIGEEAIQPVPAFKIDRVRIDRVMRKISYALYYKKYGATWNRELAIGSEYLRTEGLAADDFGLLIQNAKRVLDPPIFEGNNPDVFQFSFQQGESEDTNDQILIMKFYEGFEVWVFPMEGTNAPKI